MQNESGARSPGQSLKNRNAKSHALSNSVSLIDCCGFMSIWGYFTSLESNSTPKIDIVNLIKCSYLKKKESVKYLLPPWEVGMDPEMLKGFLTGSISNLYHQKLT